MRARARSARSKARTEQLAGYAPAPRDRRASEQDFLAMLPPLEAAELQMNGGYILGTIRSPRLGSYAAETFVDSRVAPKLQAFQNQLAEIEEIISKRNTRREPCLAMLPSRIPQSIDV